MMSDAEEPVVSGASGVPVLTLTPPTADELAEFKSQVSEWVKIDDQIKKLRVAIRERNVHQKALGAKIQQFMKQHKYDNLNTAQGKINHSVREVKTTLKIKDVKDKIYDIADQGGFDDTLVKRIHEIFDGERPTILKEGLRRQVPKVSLHLDL
jgi:DNA repair ATPase RecN